MSSGEYEAKQLKFLLNNCHQKSATGTLHLEVTTDGESKRKSCVVVWCNGKITYGGANIPSSLDLSRKLVRKTAPNTRDNAIEFALQKVTAKESVRELLELLVRLRLLKWESVEILIRTQVVLALESILPYPGKFQFNPRVEFDICYGEDRHGLDWSLLMKDLAHRQKQWTALNPTIPSMDAIPRWSKESLAKINNAAARKHLQQWVDGKRSLIDIAEQMEKDPLQIALTYLKWTQLDWMTFEKNIPAAAPDQNSSANQSTILAVDDSLIAQTKIERALGTSYNLLLASNAIDALKLLNQNPVSLLLLDVTMPDIDGLQVCRTVRSIARFSELPIIMLTGKDSLIDKMKGRIAGTSHYLTKPFEPSQLQTIVRKYLTANS